MKTLKLLFIIVIACSFGQCSTVKLSKTAPFTITGATYHNWVGGQPGVRGTNLIIGIDNTSNLEIKNIYFRGRKHAHSLEKRKNKEYVVVNMNTSKRLVKVEQTITYSGDGPPSGSKKGTLKLKKLPFSLGPTEAVIAYVIGNKIYYYKVTGIKKTETLFYP